MTSHPSAIYPSQDLDLLRHVFQQVDEQSCPERYNFHNHTCFSDGKLEPEESIAQALQIGLKDMAITDHHSVGSYPRAKKFLDQQSSDLRLWIGTEITAYIGKVDVHILAYGFDPEREALRPYLQGHEANREHTDIEQVITAIHGADGLAVLAHPSRYRLPTELVVETAVECGIDGLETYYAYKHSNPWVSTPSETERVLGLVEKYGLFATCGTDTHGTNLRLRL
jgi:predicted metal-dependent phosphoesterase TrpH